MKDNFMNNIKVYAAEKRDGLFDKLNNNIISFASAITNLNVTPDQDNIIQAKANNYFKGLAASIEQPDLVRKYSILASVGWNENDDVFYGEELFNARSTPVDKQVNFMHDELKIIGHMTESFILDENRNLIKTNSVADLPAKFDIGVAFVLYKMWEDKERSELMSRVIAEMESGNWFVSMECRFPNFDYALIDKSGAHKVMARNEESAFLTKHLRTYGGTGVYQNYRVGRLLRGLFFSGKGIVDNPANKRSEIINNVQFLSTGNLKLKEVKMEELDKIKAELSAALADNKRLSQEVDNKTKAAIAEQVTALTAQKTQIEETAKAEVTALKSQLAEANINLTKVIAEVKAAKDDCEEQTKEMAKIKAEVAKSARIAQLTKVGLDDAKASEVYNKFASLADEQFSEIVSLYKKSESSDMSDSYDENEEDESSSAADLSKAEIEPSKVGNTTNVDKTTAEKLLALGGRLAQFMPKAKASLQTQDK
jgi:hypothetical protein